LAGSRVRFELLVGGLAARKRKAIIESLAKGDLDLVVGTHALLQRDVEFKSLALVIIDEQHRFGVRQRAAVRAKGPSPHYLVMTATPIPRTLAMTVFGDLDITTIEDMPPGRTPVETKVAAPQKHDAAWQFVRKQLNAGRQAYVVYPIIDESDKSQLKAATTECKRLSQGVFSGYRMSLLHGRLSDEERTSIMSDFVAGKTQVLVATTVIEVGIDVPNAACMVIEHADRYGLSQLHQLRGRVGRGGDRGYCILMTDSALAVENERLAILSRTTNGFTIAEEDLRIRGPGQMLGLAQHGLPELRVADLIEDAALLRRAQRDAGEIIRDDPKLSSADHAPLKRIVFHRFKEMFGVVGVG
ncbi:MAG TPA: helicase-related protein, partial [Phycisphaerae bacterium]|nr:helicase-related protein [Phycisphaerae bacterium]